MRFRKDVDETVPRLSFSVLLSLLPGNRASLKIDSRGGGVVSYATRRRPTQRQLLVMCKLSNHLSRQKTVIASFNTTMK